MPRISAHGNTNVSKIWFVILVACIAMIVVVWDAKQSINQIVADSLHTQMQIDNLLMDKHR